MDNGAESHHSPSRGSVHHPDGNDDSAESLRLADDTTGKRSRLPPSHPLSQNQLGPPEKRIRAATVGTTPPPNTASTSTTSSAAQQQLTREEPNLGENDTPPHSPDSFVEREEEEDGCRVPATTATTATTTPASGEVADRVHGIGILKGDSNLVGHSTPKSPIGIIQRPTTSHSESVCSDLSSVSGATTTDDGKYPVSYVVNHNERRHESSSSDIAFSADKDNLVSRGGQRSLSPNPRFRVPPAPPSTPASLRSSLSLSFSFDGLSDFVGPPSLASSMSTPIAPMLAGGCYVRSSDILEQQQQQQRRLQQDMFDGGATPMTQSAERTAAVANTGSGSSSGATFIMEPATPKPAATEAATPKPSGPTPTSAKPSTMATAPLPDDFSDWTVGERYKLVRILGRGSYGEVAQAIDVTKTAQGHGEPVYVAIKRIQSPFDQQLDAVRLYREIHILRRMKEGGEDVVPPTNQSQKSHHDCIILLLDVVQPKALEDFNDLYLVFEYVDTDLYKLIMSPQYLTTEHIQTFLYQILCAIKWIHSFNVFHRDLKPANILLNEDCSLKICDFGLARIVGSDAMSTNKAGGSEKVTVIDREDSKILKARSMPAIPKTNLTRQLTKHVVTRWYRAPELILIQPYTSAVDIWSVGCIFAELLSMQEGNVPGYQDRKPLFPGGTCFPLSGEGDSIKADDRLDQLSVIFSVIGTPSPDDIEAIGKANEYIAALPKTKGNPLETLYPAADPAAIDLLKKMLYFNPKRRVTAEEALEHEFFKGVRRKDLERTADGPLEGPNFLEADNIDLQLLKQRTYEEVLWYRDHNGKQEPDDSDVAAFDS